MKHVKQCSMRERRTHGVGDTARKIGIQIKDLETTFFK